MEATIANRTVFNMDFFLQLKSVSLRLWRRRHPSAQLLLSLKRLGFGKPSWRILPAPLGATRAAHVRTHLLELLSLCLLIGKPYCRLLHNQPARWSLSRETPGGMELVLRLLRPILKLC